MSAIPHSHRFATPGHPEHDACAVMWLAAPELFTHRMCHVAVELAGLSRGRTVVDRWGRGGAAPNVRLLETLDPARLLRPPRRPRSEPCRDVRRHRFRHHQQRRRHARPGRHGADRALSRWARSRRTCFRTVLCFWAEDDGARSRLHHAARPAGDRRLSRGPRSTLASSCR